MKLLAIGAHPDDIEIFMYGLISLCLDRGDEINLAIATDGAAGNILFSENLKNERAEEAKRGLSKLGVPHLMGFPDGCLSDAKNAFNIISEYIKKIKPDFIITHDPNDYHSDHIALSNIISQIASFYCPVFFSETLMGVNFQPDFYVDITNYYNNKIEAILEHKSQSPEKFTKVVTIMNRYRAAQCNAPDENYFECYRTNKKFPFTDVSSFLPSSPTFRPYYKNKDNSLV